MTIKCDVILDSEQVDAFLTEHDHEREFGPVAVGDDPEAGALERNGLTHILLGKNRGGVATVLLCHEVPSPPENKTQYEVIPTSLALLEHVVGEMRAAVGEDSRLDGDPAVIEEGS
ncbi:MAG: hypothetical protein O7G84_01140 [Gammaproteobacteria bacterium]|nr:hypothetical protein [Gammaproteobacteria bacterium]